jgi:hypothetical protein
MLAWYDEDPAMLHRAVSSLHVIADRLVAADGRWDYYPGETTGSPSEQREAITDAAGEHGITVLFDEPVRAWSGQVEKRNHLLGMAQPSDWLLPLDADWELEGEREPARRALETAAADALTVRFYTPPPGRDVRLHDVASTAWHANMAGTTVREPLVWRNLPEIRIENQHWMYSAVKDGRRVSLWGYQYPPADTADLDAVRIVHHCLSRDERTVMANRAYCERRDAYTAEHGREP